MRQILFCLGVIVLIIVLASCAEVSPVERILSPTPSIPISRPVSSEPVRSNKEWTPIIEEHKGVRMALVPPGCFMMGIKGDQIAYLLEFPGSNMTFEEFHDQQPAHEVCFDEPFWIDVYEVTQVQFAGMNGEAALESYFSGDELPREQITWAEASKFCEKRGARLPSEAEWDYAARGPDGDLFRWGDIFDCRKGNFDDSEIDDPFLIDGYPDCDGFSTTAAVGSIAEGASWVGAMDLLGNVWEWAADKYGSRYYGTLDQAAINPTGPSAGDHYVVRGGAWSTNEVDHLSAVFRGGIDPATAVEHLGFRCAKSYK